MDSTPIDYENLREYTMLEVGRHDGGAMISTLKLSLDVETNPSRRADILDELNNYSDRAWLVIYGLVIDVTDFRKRHPAGEYVINNCLGKNATEDFEDVYHSIRARSLLKPLVVGKIKGYDGDLTRAFRRND
jgi:cytochrome b involved in lipid metabolism